MRDYRSVKRMCGLQIEENVMAKIRAQPGATTDELARAAELSTTTIRNKARILATAGLVYFDRSSGIRKIYPQ